MACSCRTSAMRIFVRSLTEVYAANNILARTAWHDTRPRVPPTGTNRLGVSSRPLYVSVRAQSSAQAEDVDKVSSPEATEQQAPREEGSPAQQAEHLTAESHVARDPESRTPLLEDDRLFEITRRSRNAIEKARKYPKAPASPRTTGEQEVQEAQHPHEVQKVPEGQEREPVRLTKIMVDETQGSVKSRRRPVPAGRDKADGRPQELNRGPVPTERKRDDRPLWAIQKEALKAKFPEGWMPRKRLSPDALAGIRALHQQFPEVYTTKVLSEKFEVSPEAIRRILKAKWEPAAEEEEDRQRRWFNRGLRIWERYAELGKKPPMKWQEAGVQQRPWNGRRGEEGEDEGDGQGVDQEKLRRLRAQLKLARSLM